MQQGDNIRTDISSSEIYNTLKEKVDRYIDRHNGKCRIYDLHGGNVLIQGMPFEFDFELLYDLIERGYVVRDLSTGRYLLQSGGTEMTEIVLEDL